MGSQLYSDDAGRAVVPVVVTVRGATRPAGAQVAYRVEVRFRVGRRARGPAGPLADPGCDYFTEAAMLRITLRELLRGARIFFVFLRHLVPILVRPGGRRAERLAPGVHHAVVALGPPLVKLSQVIASSPGLFPPPISDELRVLLDDAPPETWPRMRDTIERSLGKAVGALFSEIEHQPLAAASIAQVHGAVLTDGTRVVVKVRRPGVERLFQRDLRLLRRVAVMAERFWRDARVLNPVGIVDDTIVSLRQELDFGREADSMERFGANLRSFGDNGRVHVPAVHRQLCGPGVLTMERVDGIKVDDILNLELTGLDLLVLLRAGVRAWIESAAEHGFFHGDVHAGNLMVDGNGRAVFLDFGIMGQLDDTTRQLVRRGVVALLHDREFDTVTKCLIDLGAHLGADVDIEKAGEAIRGLAEPLLAKPLSELDYQKIFVDAIRLASPHGVQIPRTLVLLFKQVIYFERYAKLVAPDWDILSDTSLIEFMIERPDGAEETLAPAVG